MLTPLYFLDFFRNHRITHKIYCQMLDIFAMISSIRILLICFCWITSSKGSCRVYVKSSINSYQCGVFHCWYTAKCWIFLPWFMVPRYIRWFYEWSLPIFAHVCSYSAHLSHSKYLLRFKFQIPHSSKTLPNDKKGDVLNLLYWGYRSLIHYVIRNE